MKWLPIKGFEDSYEVSDTGLIRSLPRPIKCGNGNIRMLRGRILSDSSIASKYVMVQLRKDGSAYYKKVHRLVAEAFIPNPNNLPMVNHKDGNKLNNDVSNLEWCTYSINARHAYENGLRFQNRKLSNDDLRFIREHYVPYSKEFGYKALSEKLGVSISLIHLAVHKYIPKYLI